MADSPHPLAQEASNPDTPAQRLEELSTDPHLNLMVASNPGAPESLLERLSRHQSGEIRRAVALNPNTPSETLLQLLPEFPAQFLGNPALPLVLLARPDFIRQLSSPAWSQLLRLEQIPSLWLQELQQVVEHKNFQYALRIKDLLYNHVAIVGEVRPGWRQDVKKALDTYATRPFRPDMVLLNALLSSQTHLLLNLRESITDTNQQHILYFLPSRPAFAQLRTEFVKKFLNRNYPVPDMINQPETPQEILRTMASSKNEDFRIKTARNPKLTPDLLHQLASDSVIGVRRAVALHQHTALADLEKLASDPEIPVRVALGHRQRIPEALCRKLVKDPEVTVRQSLARNPQLPEEIFGYLLYDPQVSVLAALARNPGLPREAFYTLFQEPEVIIQQNLARNPQLPHDLMQQLLQNKSLPIQRNLAKNKRLPIALLKILYGKHTDIEVLAALARNPQTTAEILEDLYLLDIPEIDENLAANKHTPEDILEVLIYKDTTQRFQHNLVSNPHTPLKYFEEVFFNRISPVYSQNEFLLRARTHPAILRDHRKILFEYTLKLLRKEVITLSNTGSHISLLTDPGLPEAMLRIFTDSSLWEERYLVTQHPRAPQTLIEELTHDGNRYVRAAARERLEVILK